MEIRVLTVGELESFVDSEQFTRFTNVPITPLRAISQQHNPNADKDDPALVIAFDEAEKLLAYFGCLPERLLKNPLEKLCWSSCWWVHPTKGQGAAMPVFYKALQLWDAKMLFDALPERSQAVLEKMGYFSFREIIGTHLFLRFKLHKIIPDRFSFLTPLKNIFYVLDTLLNIPVSWWLHFRKSVFTKEESIAVKRISTIDDQTIDFIKSTAENEIVLREKNVFNWILRYPWLSSNNAFTKRYFFSSYANHFENILLNIYENEILIGFLWLTLRDGTAKLPYCYLKPGKESIVAKVLQQRLIDLPIDTFICFQQNLLPEFTLLKIPKLHQKQISKTFGWTKTLDTYFSADVYVQDGDGDFVFT